MQLKFWACAKREPKFWDVPKMLCYFFCLEWTCVFCSNQPLRSWVKSANFLVCSQFSLFLSPSNNQCLFREKIWIRKENQKGDVEICFSFVHERLSKIRNLSAAKNWNLWRPKRSQQKCWEMRDRKTPVVLRMYSTAVAKQKTLEKHEIVEKPIQWDTSLFIFWIYIYIYGSHIVHSHEGLSRLRTPHRTERTLDVDLGEQVRHPHRNGSVLVPHRMVEADRKNLLSAAVARAVAYSLHVLQGCTGIWWPLWQREQCFIAPADPGGPGSPGNFSFLV